MCLYGFLVPVAGIYASNLGQQGFYTNHRPEVEFSGAVCQRYTAPLKKPLHLLIQLTNLYGLNLTFFVPGLR